MVLQCNTLSFTRIFPHPQVTLEALHAMLRHSVHVRKVVGSSRRKKRETLVLKRVSNLIQIRKGVCSNWLYSHGPGPGAGPAYLRRGKFTLRSAMVRLAASAASKKLLNIFIIVIDMRSIALQLVPDRALRYVSAVKACRMASSNVVESDCSGMGSIRVLNRFEISVLISADGRYEPGSCGAVAWCIPVIQ